MSELVKQTSTPLESLRGSVKRSDVRAELHQRRSFPIGTPHNNLDQ